MSKSTHKRNWWKCLVGNPLFWVLAIVLAMLLFIELFEQVPEFGVNKIYHIFY